MLDDNTKTVSAVALSAPEHTDYGSKLTVAVQQDGTPNVKTMLYVFEDLPEINAGNSLTFTARFKLADTVFGEETDGYFSKGIYLTAYAEGGIAITDRHTPLRYLPAYIADHSGQVIDRIFPDGVHGFMRALLLGDTSGVLQRACALIGYGGGRRVTYRGGVGDAPGVSRRFCQSHRPEKNGDWPLSQFPSSCCLWPSLASARRWHALALCRFFFFARRFSSVENDVFTSLSASLMLILLINPYAAVSAGLQLSFAATLGLALFAEKLYTRLDKPLRSTKLNTYKPARLTVSFFIGGLSSTLAALAFSVPLTAIHFGSVSIIAPVDESADTSAGITGFYWRHARPDRGLFVHSGRYRMWFHSRAARSLDYCRHRRSVSAALCSPLHLKPRCRYLAYLCLFDASRFRAVTRAAAPAL